MTPDRLSEAEVAELDALMSVNDTVGGPSFIRRFHWYESGYASLVRRGLVKWGDPPEGFDRKLFAGVTITDSGRRALSSSPKDRGE